MEPSFRYILSPKYAYVDPSCKFYVTIEESNTGVDAVQNRVLPPLWCAENNEDRRETRVGTNATSPNPTHRLLHLIIQYN